MDPVLGHLSAQARQLRDLIAPGGGRLQRRIGRQGLPAVRAAAWPMLHQVVHFLDRPQRAPMRRMPRLAPRPPASWAGAVPSRRLGRVAGGRARGVRRVLAQPRLERLHPGLELAELLLDGGEVVLEGEQLRLLGENQRLSRGRSLRPDLRR
jgi:hypothetical protein